MASFRLILSSLVYLTRGFHQHQNAGLSRMGAYELIHVNTNSFASERIIEFSAFNQYYKIKLYPNKHMIPSQLRHANINPFDHHSDPYFTSITESCHYFGTVLNANDSSYQVVALSLCKNRGIRGHIIAFNETLIIKPSAYYFDQSKLANTHHINDQHLIYRHSDFDTFDIGKPKLLNFIPFNHNHKKPIIHSSNSSSKRRRRLYSSSNPAQTELLIVSGPILTKAFQTEYGSRWYEELVAYHSDTIHGVSAFYMSQNWGSAMSTNALSIKFVELEVVHEFTSRYAMLRPSFYSTNCQSSYTECNINGRAWLNTFKTWIAITKDVSTFDNAQLIDDIAFAPSVAGWGNAAAVCRGSSSVSDIFLGRSKGWGDYQAVRTIAHELGHNFGMSHDGQSGDGSWCSSNDGLMGYGSGEGFSACSVRSFNAYFAASNGLTCLSDSLNDFSSNYDDGSSQVVPTPSPVSNPTYRPTMRPNSNSGGDEWNCVGISGMVGNDIHNGNWREYGTNDGKTSYILNSYYLYFNSVYSFWIISLDLGSNGVKSYCRSSDLSSCSGQFISYTTRGWVTETSMRIYSCVEGGSSNGGSDGSDNGNENTLPCSNYECLLIAAMTTDKYGHSYNGQWIPSGCVNGQSYYTMQYDDSNRILCFSADYNLWIITDNVQCRASGAEIFGYSPQQSTEIMETRGNWQIMGAQGWIYDEDVMLTDCVYNERLTQCYNEEYGDNLCINSNDMLWNGNQTFELYTKLCSYNEPIYHYKVYTESSKDEISQSENRLVETVYFLHFVKELLYSDGDEFISKWVISKDEVSINSIAECAKSNLLECTQNSWLVEPQITKADDGFFDEFIPWIYAENMELYVSECPSSKDTEPKSTDIALIVGLCAAVALICVCCGCFVWCRCNKSETRNIQKVISQSRINLSPKYMMRQVSDLTLKSPKSQHEKLEDVELDEEFIDVTVEIDATETEHMGTR